MCGNAAAGIQQKSINSANPTNNACHLTTRDTRNCIAQPPLAVEAAAAAAAAVVVVSNSDHRHSVV